MKIKNIKDLKKVKSFSDLNLRQTFRAHIIYEQIMGESFNSKAGLNGMIVLFYSYIMGCNKDATIDYDGWFDWLDENPQMLAEFTDWVVSINKARVKDNEEREEPQEDSGAKKNE